MNRNLLSAIIVGIGGFLIFYLIIPEYNANLAVKRALTDRGDLFKTRSELLANEKKLMETYSENVNNGNVANLMLLVPEKRSVEEIIIDFQTTAQNNGLQLSEISIGVDSRVTADRKIISIKLTIAGSYTSFFSFLKQVEQSLRIYDVNEISFSKNTAGTGFNLDVKINAYSLK